VSTPGAPLRQPRSEQRNACGAIAWHQDKQLLRLAMCFKGRIDQGYL